jgi:iron complex transport system ATP-binding protein
LPRPCHVNRIEVIAISQELVFKIHGVECSYGAHKVLSGVNLDVAPGSFLGIIGPNAAGKSTLIKTIAATLKPTRGVVYFKGEDLTKVSRRDLAQQMAVVPQETEINFPFSVMEVVLMGRHPHLGRFEQESEQDYEIVCTAMEKAGCWHLKDRSILELSGGERQKVILARALAQNPSIILLDEPVAHLDLSAQLEVLTLLQEMNREHGITVIAILHDLNMAAQFSEQMIMLHQGKIFAAGLPEKVLNAENIKEVYNTDVLVIRHPITGDPQIVVLPSKDDKQVNSDAPHIHLICGGGVGGALMGHLYRQGYNVTAGVVNIQDTDWDVGHSLGLQIVEEKPFSSISTEKYKENLRLAMDADAVFLLETPFGKGNIPNAQVLEPLLDSGKPCYLIDPEHLAERDYTGGEVCCLIKHLQEKGLLVLQDQLAVLRVVQKLGKVKNDEKAALG